MTLHARASDGPAAEARFRLRSIDALRGAAALAVVLYHAAGQSPADGAAHAVARAAGAAVRAAAAHGYLGVFLFFVISGFCIHLNQAKARAEGRTLSVEFLPFWRRRVRRLYPPYLVALALSLAVAAASVGLPATRHFAWDVISHLLMLHNFDPSTCYSISSVFWTLAVEEQLYLAYFALLAARRRWGWRGALALCLAARAGWFALTVALRAWAGVEVPFAESAAAHWFTWALGALAVESAFGLVRLPRWTRDARVAAVALVAAGLLAYAQDAGRLPGGLREAAWLLLHPAWGFGFFVLLNRAVASERRAQSADASNAAPTLDAPNAVPTLDAPSAARTLDAPPRVVAHLAAVGVVSYSLYLTHPLVLLFAWRLAWLPLPPLATHLLVVVPLCLAFAWLFFQLCERPFLTKRRAADAAAPTRDAARPSVVQVAIGARYSEDARNA